MAGVGFRPQAPWHRFCFFENKNLSNKWNFMQPIILLPIVFAGTRALVSRMVNQRIDRGIAETTTEAVQRISRSLLKSLLEMGLNVVIFLAVIYKAGDFFDHQTAVLLICSVYAGSIIHAVWKLSANLSLIITLVKKYRLNLKKFVYAEIYEKAHFEAQQKLAEMGMVGRFFYKVSSGPDATTIALAVAGRAAPIIWRRILTKGVMVGLTIGMYIMVFRVLISPFLIQQTTRFNLLQAFLWPFAYSVDFFLGADLSRWVMMLG
jgi:hypothetical protein